MKKKYFLILLSTIITSISCKSNNDKIIHVILIAGQSNAIGWSPTEDAKSRVSESVFAKYNIKTDNQKIIFQNYGKELMPGLLTYNENFEQVGFGQGLTEYQFGPEVGIAKVLRENKPNEQYCFIKYAMNSSTINEDWKLSSNFYKEFKAFTKKYVEELQKTNKINVDCLMWMQGENDSTEEEVANNYGAGLKTIFEDIQNTFNKNMIIIDAGISDCSYWKYYTKINEQKKELDKTVKNHYYFDTVEMDMSFYDPSKMHYDGPSMLKLGSKFGNEYLNYFK